MRTFRNPKREAEARWKRGGGEDRILRARRGLGWDFMDQAWVRMPWDKRHHSGLCPAPQWKALVTGTGCEGALG